MASLESNASGFACIFDYSSFIWSAWAEDEYFWFSLLLGVFSLRVGMIWGSMIDCVIDCAIDCIL